MKAVVWTPRLHEDTGIAHAAAAVRYGPTGALETAVMGYQTRCRGSYRVHDEYVIETIPPTSPVANQVTCLECLAAETE